MTTGGMKAAPETTNQRGSNFSNLRASVKKEIVDKIRKKKTKKPIDQAEEAPR
jgi:hypothetical protein